MNQLWAMQKQDAQKFSGQSVGTGKIPKDATGVTAVAATATKPASWKVKIGNNTVNVTSGGNSGTFGGILNTLEGKKAPTFTVEEIMEQAEAQGSSQTQIMTALQNAGYTIQ